MGGWSHSSTEPAGGVSKLQSINHSTLLRSRSQRVAKLVSSLLLPASQARGSRVLDHRSSHQACRTTGQKRLQWSYKSIDAAEQESGDNYTSLTLSTLYSTNPLRSLLVL